MPAAFEIRTDSFIAVGWPNGPAAIVLEGSSALGGDAYWTAVTNLPVINGNSANILVSPAGAKFFRLRQAW